MVAIILIASISFTSCTQTPQEKLISRTEDIVKEQLIPNLKDPKSFEKKDVRFDTITTKMWINQMMDLNLREMKHNLEMADIWIGTDNLKAKEYNDKVFVLKRTNDSLLNIFNNTSDTSIASVNISYLYRAKNGFGALDIQTANFSYVPSEDKLSYWK